MLDHLFRLDFMNHLLSVTSFCLFVFLNQIDYKYGYNASESCKSTNCSVVPAMKIYESLPIETSFRFPSPLPSWPPGENFAKGTMELGSGLEVCQISTFSKIWSMQEGGPDNQGATFFEPTSIPQGFFPLGFYAQPNNRRLFGWVLAGKDSSGSVLKPPVDFNLAYSSESSKIKQDGFGFIWVPIPPNGYHAVGVVVTNSAQKPSLDKIRCVRSDMTDQSEADTWIWGTDGMNVSSLRPINRGTQAQGVSVGTFGGFSSSAPLFCLKNTKFDLSYMPTMSQIEAIFKTYSPSVYFHPDEEYFPASVKWYFSNGALLYKNDDELNPVSIEPDGSNLPQGGADDGVYWLGLPVDETAKERVKKGDLQNSEVYLHIKPMFGAAFTDIAVWLFYPFNGPARAKVKFIKNISLGKIGEHIGDWEHLTLRVSNFDGELKRMFFSEHSGGLWKEASELEFQGGSKTVAYSSLHGHAMYPKPGLVLQGDKGIGIRNDAGRGKVLDLGSAFSVVDAEYLNSRTAAAVVVEPPWLNYFRKWGPKIDYDIDERLRSIEKRLPGLLKKAFRKVVSKIPREVFGEDGPTGPKAKRNWNGDEQ